ncbi:MAG: UPF0182 family protein [Aigarchaeota archaeon]|nr:UPF0182 family protein [Candidatus Geocrenenecus dongiae]
MYYSSPRRISRRRTILLIIILLIVLTFSLNQILQVMLNFWEFGELFIKPYYYSLIGGLVLSFIAFFRLDFKNRPSLVFWFIRIFVLVFWERYLRSRDLDFSAFKLTVGRFIAWQVTKTLIGAVFFGNAFFGMVITGAIGGLDLGLTYLPEIFKLPFMPISSYDVTPAQVVINTSPLLLLIVPPLITALTVRLVFIIGMTLLVKEISKIVVRYLETNVLILPVKAIEALIAIASAWIGFTLFFSNYIDYNTKVLIIGSFTVSLLMVLFLFLDKKKTGFLYAHTIKIGATILIILTVFSVVTIQNSIADARKIEWYGPYVKQEITVNRYLADIENVKKVRYIFQEYVKNTPIETDISRFEDYLDIIRLWDWEAAFTKMKPEIGLIPYVDFEDSDILRFNGRLYWSASMKPILPVSVKAADIWYNQHLVYTHVPNGFLLLDASNGTMVDSSIFFKQRRIYYGEGGLIETTWAAIILDKEESDEITGTRYAGQGGIVISPPITWLYDPTFFFSYPDKTIKIIRYRDVYSRMSLLFPYFVYIWGTDYVDMFPVTDGERTYWLMPLIVELKGEHVPWSKGNSYVRFIGYALIDVYDGTIRLIITGSDFVSKIIKMNYPEVILEDVPTWLYNQTRYPMEVFEYQVEVFNNYHMDDVSVYIQAREFYEIPKGLYTYYIITQPQGFEKPEFLGILSLQIRGSPGRNLAGFMIIRNDYPYLGEKIFYYVPQDSEKKLLGPSAAREALERYPEFKKLQTLLENPRIGEIILYNIGEHIVYVIPVYTSPAGATGVITQLGTIAVVGAEFTGSYYVALGNSIREAFINYLKTLRGVTTTPSIMNATSIIDITIKIVEKKNLKVVFPEKINAHLEFGEGNISYTSIEEYTLEIEKLLDSWIEKYDVKRVLLWTEDGIVKLGVILINEGIVELHYVNITSR